jgi:hypothetical protein
MVLSSIRTSENIMDALIQRARTRSDPRLSADLIGGTFVATAAAVWRPTGWLVIASAALCFVAFGAWGFADRLLNDAGQRTSGSVFSFLLVFRTIAVTVGFVSALLLLFGAADLAMGTWIS